MIELPVFKFALVEGLSDIFLPTRAHETDTGWDVRAAENFLLEPGQYVKIPLGFRVFAPQGWWLELHPRSSSFTKKNLHALYGVIDEAYQGQCLFACQYLHPENWRSLQITAGEAIGQLIPVKRQEMLVERVSNQEYEQLTKDRNFNRGAGGFGSTSK